MAQYIKSHSTYVLRKKHQATNDGTIWEHDISTVGGVDSFVNGEVPTYQSGNFVITRNPSKRGTIQIKPSKWSKNDTSEIWTLSNMSGITSLSDFEDDTKIIIKKDYFDLRDFAYYGSLTELFRSSLNDIANRFPGELYSYSADVYYTEWKTVNGENITVSKKLGNGGYLLSNPYGIDLHTKLLPKDANKDKYFAEEGYKGYSIRFGNELFTRVTAWTSSPNTSCCTIGDCIGTVTLNSNITISGYFGNDMRVYYFTNTNNIHIRPSQTRLTKFYNECNEFERVILNPNTTPKYKATFSVIKENEYGFYRELEDFVFPTSEGGYNLDVTTFGYNRYTSRLSDIGEYYDEMFCDNLYRSMTHESIKNFDWTFSRYEDENEEYIQSAERIKKALRVFAREFDEIKGYIDSMTSLNRITYDDRNNLPDYFLTDSLELDGWDVKKPCPYSSSTSYTWAQLNNASVEKRFFQDYSQTVKPYTSEYGGDFKDGYFVTCCNGTNVNALGYNNGGSLHAIKATAMTMTEDCGANPRGYIERIRSHFDEKEYSMYDVDNEFLRRLKINSRAILRSKGTVQGIEMILGMFGLKSKQYDQNGYDYTIDEYYLETDGIEYTAVTNALSSFNTDFEKVNTTKLIGYPRNEEDNPLRGLPMIHYNKGGINRYYPYYNEDEPYDGGLYYQMGGGWMSNRISGSVVQGNSGLKNFQFDVDDNIVSASNECRLYKETIRTIRKVDNLNDLLSIPKATLSQYDLSSDSCSIIYYVENVSDKVGLLGGKVYDLYSEVVGNSTYDYVKLVKQDGFVQVGDGRFFDEVITVNLRDGSQEHVYLRDKEDGYVIKAYADSNGNIVCSEISGKTYNLLQDSNATNYFALDNIDYSDKLRVGSGNNGWKRLSTADTDYKKINAIYNYVKGNNPHGSTFGYDMGEEYIEYLKKPFKYALENDLFDDRCYSPYSAFKTAMSGLSMSGLDTNTLKSGNKIVDTTSNPSYISLSKVNTKRIKITFKTKKNDACELKYLDDIVSNYLMQMIPSTAIVEVLYAK